MKILVRNCRAGEAREAKRVAAAAFATVREVYRPKPEARKRKSALDSALARIVALADGRIVGTAQYRLEMGSLAVVGLGVLPEFRRRGVARRMMELLVEVARRAGSARLSLHLIRETGNAAFFEKLGFRAVEENPAEGFESDDFDRLTDVRMQLVVSDLRHGR
ncbi:MAG: GNAT family N-acetyltransferase [Planctomycetota bacterium]